MKTKLSIVFSFALAVNLYADSATWNLNPTSGDWNTAANWTPATVPNGPSDTATFATSNTTGVSLSADTEINGIVFNPSASAFTISPNPVATLTISGSGITNNSGAVQNFMTTPDADFNHATILFTNNATAGDLTTFTNKAAVGIFTYGGTTVFDDNSVAGSATFITEGGAVGGQIVGGNVVFQGSSSAGTGTFITGGGTTPNSNGGEVAFIRSSTAGNGTFINNPGTAFHAQGGFVEFLDANATAGDATFINNGAAIHGASGGATTFSPGSAGNSTLIANGGTNGGEGGWIALTCETSGDSPRVEVFGNGTVYLGGQCGNPTITVGSLEGDGIVAMSNFPLIVGLNNLSTIFAGTMIDINQFGGGTLIKTGTGTLILTGANRYAGGTIIKKGKLEVSNRHGSGTGTGPVHVNRGSLGGRGTIAGNVTIGTAGGSHALLAPGRVATVPQTLTILGSLTFNSGATYNCDINSSSATADIVVSNGVTINSAGLFSLADSGDTTLASGTVLTVISNTATTPIAGMFSNLPDGSTITIGNNTFQASYEGGDGNDLTLTVVP
jgi:autotransporter-associated beta strand protein